MNQAHTHLVILVSGAPGAGKTTLAAPLAKALGFSLLSKDTIKEVLFDTLDGIPGDMQNSRWLGNAAMELLWTLARKCPRVVLEANFRPRNPYERTRINSIEGQILEVYCQCPTEELIHRFDTRARQADHHPAHALSKLTPEYLNQYDGPFDLCPVITVNTSKPVDINSLVSQIRKIWYVH